MWLLIALSALLLLLGAAGIAYYLLTHRTRGRHFESGGVQLHYTDEGIGEPVILLHGFAVNADLNWRRPGLTRALAKDHRVIALDLRGHGLSDKPRGASSYGVCMAEDVIRLLDHLGIDRAHVAGYSLGGFVALRLAVDHPERLRSALVLGAGWERTGNSAFLDAIGKLADALESGKGIAPLTTYLGGDRRPAGSLHVAWVKLMTKWFNDPQAMIGVIRGTPAFGLSEQDLAGVRVPMCAIVGSEDPLRLSAEALSGALDHCSLTIVDNADHMSTPGRPETLAAVRRFLESG